MQESKIDIDDLSLELLLELKNDLGGAIDFEMAEEDGSISFNSTPFGRSVLAKITKLLKKNLENG